MSNEQTDFYYVTFFLVSYFSKYDFLQPLLLFRKRDKKDKREEMRTEPEPEEKQERRKTVTHTHVLKREKS